MKINFNNPLAYLKEFYSQIEMENESLIAWLECIPFSQRVIEIGCGPSLMAALAYGKRVEEIVLQDLEHFNLALLERMLHNKDIFPWEIFEQRVGYTLVELARKVSFQNGSILDPCKEEGSYDGAVCCFGLEAAGLDPVKFQLACSNFMAYIKPGGWFRTSIINSTNYYIIQGESFSVGEVTYNIIQETLLPYSWNLHVCYVPPTSDHGYKGFYLLEGNKNE